MSHFSFPVINPGKEKKKKKKKERNQSEMQLCMTGLESQLAYPLGNTTLLLIKR